MTEPLYDTATLWDLVVARAEATPDALMLVDDGDRRLTFGEFRDRAERAAAGFADLGVRPGTRVTWQLPNRFETVIASLRPGPPRRRPEPDPPPLPAARRSASPSGPPSAEFVLVPGEWKGFDYAAMVERADRRPARAARASSTCSTDLPDGDPAGLAAAAPPTATRIRWIYFTSGTTSDPKGVRHTDAHAHRRRPAAWPRPCEMTPDDVGSIAFPFAHIAGPDYLVHDARSPGFPAVFFEAFVPDQAIADPRRATA